jgi:putative oxidoreductase
MTTFGAGRARDEIILVARVLLVLLFVTSGWAKLTDYAGTVGYLAQIGTPMPSLAAVVAIVCEFFVALAVGFGLWTRPLALVLAIFTLAATLIGHAFWTMEGAARFENAINFYKNLGVIGACLLFFVTGAGRHSVDARLGLA